MIRTTIFRSCEAKVQSGWLRLLDAFSSCAIYHQGVLRSRCMQNPYCRWRKATCSNCAMYCIPCKNTWKSTMMLKDVDFLCQNPVSAVFRKSLLADVANAPIDWLLSLGRGLRHPSRVCRLTPSDTCCSRCPIHVFWHVLAISQALHPSLSSAESTQSSPHGWQLRGDWLRQCFHHGFTGVSPVVRVLADC